LTPLKIENPKTKLSKRNLNSSKSQCEISFQKANETFQRPNDTLDENSELFNILEEHSSAVKTKACEI